MALVTQSYRASDVMDMQQRGSIQGSLPFADCAFRANRSGPDFVGAGLYACFYRNQLIYVGKYLGMRDAWRQGNVIAMRWVKHIGTFTMRARHLGFSDAAYDAVVAHYQQSRTEADDAIQNGFLSADRCVLVRETGCMTTFRRFLVASRIHAETGGEASLEGFSFLYTRVDADGTTPELRERVSAAEAKLLQRVHPEGNTIPNAFPPARVDQSEVRRLLEDALGGSQAPTPASVPPALLSSGQVMQIIPTEPEDTGAEARFLDQIEAAPAAVQDFIRLLTEAVANTPNAEVNYTDTPDLRIRSYGVQGRRFRNVITIEWQPSAQRLLMRSLLPDSELRAHGLSLDRIGGRVLKHETFLTLDLLGTKPDDIIKAILRAHELARRGSV